MLRYVHARRAPIERSTSTEHVVEVPGYRPGIGGMIRAALDARALCGAKPLEGWASIARDRTPGTNECKPCADLELAITAGRVGAAFMEQVANRLPPIDLAQLEMSPGEHRTAHLFERLTLALNMLRLITDNAATLDDARRIATQALTLDAGIVAGPAELTDAEQARIKPQ